MSKEIVVNVAREETRVALLENKVVAEFYTDRKKDRGIVGNIYKGRVVKVLPGMQASFVDIGLQKGAFLYVDDVASYTEDYTKLMEYEGDEKIGHEKEAPRLKRSNPVSIEDLLQEGQEIMVQISKEPMGTKGPRVTTYISLPGRYLVYMPTINHIGISRRISGEEERNRLKEMIARMRRPGTGYIVRTVSEGKNEEDLMPDLEFLQILWENILKKHEILSAPVLLHTDLDLVFRTIRDLFTKEVDRLIVDSKEEYERVKEFVEGYLPDLVSKIEYYDKEEPVFDAFEIEMEISRALGRKIWLKSGGYIVIDQTEALTVIDVNTGRYVGKRNLEDTILKTNLEAVKEIAYQLRLRNIGGIIIIDFIDMEKEKNKEKVFTLLQEAAKADKARTNILKISELGLVEMSRERVRENLMRTLCESCVYCDGRGYTKSPTTVCYEIFREIRKMGVLPRDKKIIIGVHPNVANLLYDEERQGIEELENLFRKKIIIKADSNLHIEEYDIVTL